MSFPAAPDHGPQTAARFTRCVRLTGPYPNVFDMLDASFLIQGTDLLSKAQRDDLVDRCFFVAVDAFVCPLSAEGRL